MPEQLQPPQQEALDQLREEATDALDHEYLDQEQEKLNQERASTLSTLGERATKELVRLPDGTIANKEDVAPGEGHGPYEKGRRA